MKSEKLSVALLASPLLVSAMLFSAQVHAQERVAPIIEGLNYPSSIALDTSGRIYVSVVNDNTVRIYAPSAASDTFADEDGLPYLGFETWPNAVAVDGAGIVYVLAHNGVSKYTRGVYGGWSAAGGVSVPEPPLSLVPTGLAVDGAGTIYVADTYGIHKFVPSEAGYADPVDITSTPTKALALDQHGNLYATGAAGIVVFTAMGSSFAAPLTIASVHANALAADASGSVYAAVTADHAVHKYAKSASGYAAQADVVSDAASTPTAVGVDAQGNVYVADSTASAITKFTFVQNAYVRATDVAHPGVVHTPAGIVVDRQGYVYLADTNYFGTTGALHKFAPSASGLTPLPDIVPFGSYTPYGVAVDKDGNVFVTEIYGRGIHKYVPSAGGYAEQAMIADDSHFSGIALDDAGDIYVCDYDGSAVRKYVPSGTGYQRAQDVTAARTVGEPIGVAVDALGNVYVSGTSAFEVVEFSPSASGYVEQDLVHGILDPTGIVVDAAGTVIVGGMSGPYEASVVKYGEGDVGQADVMISLLRRFSAFAPIGLTTDTVGNLYLTEGDNDRVIKVQALAKSTAVLLFPNGGYNVSIGDGSLIEIEVIGNNPKGTVSVALDGQTACNAVPLVDSGVRNMAGAECGVGSSTTGPHLVTATYNGDANNSGSSGSVLLNVVRAEVRVFASADAFHVTQGKPVKLSAQVRAFSGFALTGNVSFYGNEKLLCESTHLQQPGGIDATAQCTTAFADSADSELITARYNGDSYNDVATSGAINVIVDAGSAFDFDQHGITGSWYNPLSSGQGIEFETYPDAGGSGHGVLFGGWFTYDTTASGGRRWYGLTGDAGDANATAALQIFDIEGGNFAAPPALGPAGALGRAVLSLNDCSNGTITYSFTDGSGRSGTIPLSRLTPNTTCSTTGDQGVASSYLLSGNWYSPATSGQGLIFDFSPSIHALFAAWYTFRPNGPQFTGAAGQDWFTLQSDKFVPGTTALDGIPIIETSGGVFDNVQPTNSVQVGSASINLHSCSAMTLAYSFTAGQNKGLTGSMELQRVGSTPSGCALQ